MAPQRIVVVGAGVAGLTCARMLSEAGYSVTVVARHMPGDYDVDYASPWAGANYLPVSIENTPAMQWDLKTFPELWRLATKVPSAGIHVVDTILYNRKKDVEGATGSWFAGLLSESPWFKDTMPDFSVLPKKELPEGIDSASTFKSVCINTAVYLPWLVSQCLDHGVVFKRAVLSHISEAFSQHHGTAETNGVQKAPAEADLVVNCTGLGALTLKGVEDKSMMPARGQITLVRNEAPNMVSISGCDDAEDETCYVMQRAAGGGTILGGSYQKGNWDGTVDEAMAERIMKRAVELCPGLVKDGPLDVVRHGVGLRPLRQGGTRLELETMSDGTKVVHNYGHGGYGYQASYGCAQEVLQHVNTALLPAAAASQLSV